MSRTMPIKLISLFLAAGMCPGAIQAEDTLPVMTMSPVLVTATRTAAFQEKVPQASEIITAEDIRRSGAYDMRSALQRATSLNLMKTARGGNLVSLRGMSSNHVLVLLNGQRIAGEDTIGLRNVNVLDRINLSSVERIEIIRSSASALYGSDAMGSVINIITKAPDTPEASVGLATGSDEASQYARYASGQQGRWSFSVDARRTKERKLLQPQEYAVSSKSYTGWVHGDDSNQYGQKLYLGLDGTYDFQNANKNKLRLTGSWTEENLRREFADDYRTFSQGKPKPFSGYFTKDKRQCFENKSWQGGLTYTGDTGKNMYLLRTYYSHLTKDSHLRNERNNTLPVVSRGPKLSPIDYNLMNPLFDFDRSVYDLWETEARNTTILSPSHSLTYGAEYNRTSLESTRAYSSTDRSVSQEGLTKAYGKENMNSFAAYLEDQWQLGPQLFLVPSVRLDHSSRFGSEVTPKVGVTWSLDDRTRLKFNYGRAYRTPTLSEMYLHFNHFGMFTLYGNPNLHPEKSIGWDAALEAERGQTFGSLSYFDNKVSNLIDYVSIPGTRSDKRFSNIGRSRIKGAEFTLGHHFNDRWTLKGTWAPLMAENEDTGTRLENRARHTVTAELSYDDHKDYGYSAVLWYQLADRYRYSGAADENSGSASGDVLRDYTFSSLNLSVRRNWGKDLSFYAGVTNILDKQTDHKHEDDLYIDGRMWHTGLEFRL